MFVPSLSWQNDRFWHKSGATTQYKGVFRTCIAVHRCVGSPLRSEASASDPFSYTTTLLLYTKNGSFYQDRLGTNPFKIKQRCVFRRPDPPTTLSYHLVNGEPRIAALPSETGIIIDPQTMEDERVRKPPPFLAPFCQEN